MTRPSLNIGIIGLGAIGSTLCRLLAQHAPQIAVRAVLARSEPGPARRAQLPEGALVVTSVDELLSLKLDVLVECAGHATLRNLGAQILASGSDLLVASVGALADPATHAALQAAAQAGQSTLRIPSGALGGLDVLGAARLAGLESVIYTSIKAPQAWQGTPAESMIDLARLTTAQAFFRGDARAAALAFPQNANVAAAVALAGLGFERTQVVLMADPLATGNRHRIQATGGFGEIDVSVLGMTLADNPKTSMLAAYSLLKSLMDLNDAVVVG